ncbi:hypothetical protein [Streptomyces sp. NRRL WC-3618]|uniref:hypothetical protein n=1 Tax=Streptomyces sp. NRRL WC-3618 TaxID=1519490 RepID=UPI000B16984E|nr:hypothetical protein [Streptomyces sp. NRRL WC-3618]
MSQSFSIEISLLSVFRSQASTVRIPARIVDCLREHAPELVRIFPAAVHIDGWINFLIFSTEIVTNTSRIT